jgi:hypothetical protein
VDPAAGFLNKKGKEQQKGSWDRWQGRGKGSAEREKGEKGKKEVKGSGI